METELLCRKVDELGRIILPAEIRDVLGIRKNDTLTVSYDPALEVITLKRSVPICAICHTTDHLVRTNGKYICRKCLYDANSEDGSIKSDR